MWKGGGQRERVRKGERGGGATGRSKCTRHTRVREEGDKEKGGGKR